MDQAQTPPRTMVTALLAALVLALLTLVIALGLPGLASRCRRQRLAQVRRHRRRQRLAQQDATLGNGWH